MLYTIWAHLKLAVGSHGAFPPLLNPVSETKDKKKIERGRERKGERERELPSPVDIIDLEYTHIKRTIIIVIHCICIPSTLVIYNALAACLIPVSLGTYGCNISSKSKVFFYIIIFQNKYLKLLMDIDWVGIITTRTVSVRAITTGTVSLILLK